MNENKITSVHRCEYKHKSFIINNKRAKGFKHDGTNQCWMRETKNYSGKYFCIFHMPEDQEDEECQKLQALTLEELIQEWNANKQNNSFLMPGMRCGFTTFFDTKFKSNINFDNSTFSGQVFFQKFTFGGEVSFYKACFRHHVLFKGVVFDKLANFSKAAFDKGANFKKTFFNKGAMFIDATFGQKDDDDVLDSSFSGVHAWFDQATFSGVVAFVETKFYGDASFQNTTFNGTRYERVRFYGDAKFNEAKFNNDTIFNEAKFHKSAEFKLAKIAHGPYMRGCKFARAPSFHDVSISQSANFREVTFSDIVSDDAAANYRTLKVAMNKASNKKQEAVFYGLEQQSLRKQSEAGKFESLFSWLYEKTANYGQSFIRPLMLLLCVNVFFLVSYTLIKYKETPYSKIFLYLVTGANNFFEKIGSFIKFSMINIFSPSKIWTGDYIEKIFGKEIVQSHVVLINALMVSQTVLSLSLITLFFLALRRSFKLN